MGVRTVRVSANFILGVSKVGTRQVCECIEGVPDDAEVVGVACEHYIQSFTLFVSSQQWPEQPADEEITVMFKNPEDKKLLDWLWHREN